MPSLSAIETWENNKRSKEKIINTNATRKIYLKENFNIDARTIRKNKSIICPLSIRLKYGRVDKKITKTIPERIKNRALFANIFCLNLNISVFKIPNGKR